MRPIDEIIIHCSATRPTWWSGRTINQKIAEIRRWHVNDRGWKDIGYHYVIDRDGTVGTGRPIDQIGAHVQGHNTGTIGVCLIGGHGAAATDKFEDHFTPEQAASLSSLIYKLRPYYGIYKITGHNDYANKGCPGFKVAPWWAEQFSVNQAGGNFVAKLLTALAKFFGGKSNA